MGYLAGIISTSISALDRRERGTFRFILYSPQRPARAFVAPYSISTIALITPVSGFSHVGNSAIS